MSLSSPAVTQASSNHQRVWQRSLKNHSWCTGKAWSSYRRRTKMGPKRPGLILITHKGWPRSPILPPLATPQHGSSISRSSMYMNYSRLVSGVVRSLHTHLSALKALLIIIPNQLALLPSLECTTFSKQPVVMPSYPGIQLATSLEWWPTQVLHTVALILALITSQKK